MNQIDRLFRHNMRPNSYAVSCSMSHKGLKLDSQKRYTLQFDDEDWCRVFLGKRKIWQCNGAFARAHFYA